MKPIAFIYLVLVILGTISGKLFVAFAGLGMLIMFRKAEKIFAEQDAPSPLRPAFVCSTMTALDRQQTESSQSFN